MQQYGILASVGTFLSECKVLAFCYKPFRFVLHEAAFLRLHHKFSFFTLSLQVHYRPNLLNGHDTATINVQCHDYSLQYIANGTGVLPPDQPTTLMAAVGQSTTRTIKWMNPLPDKATIKFELVQGQSSAGVLSTEKQGSVSVVPMETVSIPITFKSLALAKVTGTMMLNVTSANQKDPVPFNFPITGFALASLERQRFSIQVRAQTSIEQDLEIVLPGKTSCLARACTIGYKSNRHVN